MSLRCGASDVQHTLSHVDSVNFGLRLALLVHLELYSKSKKPTRSYITAQNDLKYHK